MPYQSKAQERWAHTESGKKALGGAAKVHEWDEATKGKRLPERKHDAAHAGRECKGHCLPDHMGRMSR